jgi:DNA polymerase-3 subunit alpha
MLDKGLADFFLATSDMVRWAKDQGIPVGPGRGSVAASVVAWLLRITEVDPIRYPNLLFERFLDVTRTDPPDIDLDFADERRHEVFEYMARKYGADRVGSVGNFIRYRAKNSLVDVARVYNVPIGAKETVSSLIIERSGGDSRFDSGLEDTVAMFPAAKKVFDNFPDLWNACRLEGNVRGMSIHAAGMIVANTPLTDVFAVYDRDGRKVLSVDKYDVEYAGALKMDCLGLTTMGVISNCLEMTGLSLEDLYAIPDDDPGALDVFRRGDVTGIFQFEGRATRLVNRDVRPDNFGEVVDINALSRPGPLFSGTTAEYVDVKHGRRDPERYHPLVTELTGHTKGQIIYQEQILQIVREIGGFDWTNANEIRRIIAKKIERQLLMSRWAVLWRELQSCTIYLNRLPSESGSDWSPPVLMPLSTPTPCPIASSGYGVPGSRRIIPWSSTLHR